MEGKQISNFSLDFLLKIIGDDTRRTGSRGIKDSTGYVGLADVILDDEVIAASIHPDSIALVAPLSGSPVPTTVSIKQKVLNIILNDYSVVYICGLAGIGTDVRAHNLNARLGVIPYDPDALLIVAKYTAGGERNLGHLVSNNNPRSIVHSCRPTVNQSDGAALFELHSERMSAVRKEFIEMKV